MNEAVFGIVAFELIGHLIDDGFFSNVERERLFAALKSKERAAVQFVENKAEALAFPDAACGAADEARHAGHSNATIMRQSLQEDAQNRSTYHKSSRNLSYNRLVKFLTKTLNFT